jgi:hypothetical protein
MQLHDLLKVLIMLPSLPPCAIVVGSNDTNTLIQNMIFDVVHSGTVARVTDHTVSGDKLREGSPDPPGQVPCVCL